MKNLLLIADTPIDSNGGAAATETNPATLLREQLIKLFNLPANAREQDIVTAAKAAREYNTNIKAQLALQRAEEEVIAKKMDAGLSRDQAISVIKRQRQHDEAIARQREQRRPRLLEIIKANAHDLRQARYLVRDEFQFMDGGEFKSAVAEFEKTL